MSRTIRGRGRYNTPDGELQSLTKDKKPRKRFMYRRDGWSSKARGGPGNKAGWKSIIPKWLLQKYKEKHKP
jgi:hypothetical protein